MANFHDIVHGLGICDAIEAEHARMRAILKREEQWAEMMSHADRISRVFGGAGSLGAEHEEVLARARFAVEQFPAGAFRMIDCAIYCAPETVVGLGNVLPLSRELDGRVRVLVVTVAQA